MNALDKYIWNEIMIQFLRQKLIPLIDEKDWNKYKNEISEQLIGEGIEYKIWEL